MVYLFKEKTRDNHMGLLSRERLLAKETLKIEKVEFEDDDFVYVRQMTGRERDRFERSLLREVRDRKGTVTYEQALGDFRAKLVVNVICDENGVNLLEPSDYDVLSAHMSAAKLELIVNRANDLNRISESDKEAMIKNSEPVQTGDVSSESAGSLDTPTPISGSTT